MVLKEKKRKKKSVGERVKRETLPDMARRVTAGDTLRPCLSMPLERAAKVQYAPASACPERRSQDLD